MMTKAVIDRIEGEASLYLETRGERVVAANIAFPHFRGMEGILEGRTATDALVLTPRVCGICGHAHLMAAVRAIKSAYAAAGHPVTLTPKAERIRELTLILEMVQNHFKWLYLVILPELRRLRDAAWEPAPLKGAYAARLAGRAIAAFAGQWPHASYMLPGGVTCEPTHLERVRAERFIDELVTFFEKELAGTSLDAVLGFSTCKAFNPLQSDLGLLERELIAARMQRKGFAHDRFLVMGEHGFSTPVKLIQTRRRQVRPEKIVTEEAYCPDERSYARNVRYNGDFYEVGPLARLMAAGTPLVRNMHRRFRDSTYTRIMARPHEIAILLQRAKALVAALPLSDASYVAPLPVGQLTAEGSGAVEAPRGVLLHRVRIEKGAIRAYEIVTPTQWNLGSSVPEDPAPAQRAMIGSENVAEAAFVFRGFDVCSVCTTH
jgi:Ni,Fe-hydrogenase I large subunit